MIMNRILWNFMETYELYYQLIIAEIEIESGMRLKTSRTSIFFHYVDTVNSPNRSYTSKLTIMFIYDTSFLNRNKVVIDGDVESNPGPVTNNGETPKGRGRPKKDARGCAKKS